ncbi:MAG: tRNA pseudouridine(13) synthase TruD [Proteobacteria bacterium]|nr:tRNA pseudouridine(13) synthase TruD [Pseudomonadota bacterium]
MSAKLKQSPEDFVVEENISLQFSGEGEHCWVYIQKRGCNTDWLAQQLARFCGVKQMAVSYAGLKDRHAVTSQWFSVQLPGLPTPDWKAFEAIFPAGEVKVLQSQRHQRKLQRGALKSNTFKITLHDLCSDEALDMDGSAEGLEDQIDDQLFEALQQRCSQIAESGVANYFGKQRFGRNANNLEQAEKFFLKPSRRLPRHKRSIYLSAARSWMFNCILSERIRQKIWNKRLQGDVFMLAGKSACFKDPVEGIEGNGSIEETSERLNSGELHPTAILWGEGDEMVSAQARDLEMEVIDQFPVFRDGLIAARLKSQRRACRVIPQNMASFRQGDSFVVSFSLPAGCYATVVLGEIFSKLVEH